MSETLTAALMQATAALTFARNHVSFERASCPESDMWKYDMFDKALTDLSAITASDFVALGRTPPTVEDAKLMGNHGAPHSEAERALFEAYMRGHCWAITGPWDPKTRCYPDMLNRIEFAVWRDRAALGTPLAVEAPAAEPAGPVAAEPDVEQLADRRTGIERADQMEMALSIIAFGKTNAFAGNPMMWPSTIAYAGLGGRYEQGKQVDGPEALLRGEEVRRELLPEFLATAAAVAAGGKVTADD